ncbi:hypothetical protein BDA96_07G088700 [Sorghum bicolor]|uniref:Uncharacterized protein n=2 Tax=Sorghum bicolor TaxID=4558 RepID=A0A1Z5R8P4_SORBI|nr:hypothetical protein BDA96_07G088700 [Sorghum bicolor]OQU80133.1 hypothetical protein SORBI_3007G085350 [Sorghum bicolor]OQU80134.1 hypothetical protein SORBI_3007G085350 [Sorghum bicolor]
MAPRGTWPARLRVYAAPLTANFVDLPDFSPTRRPGDTPPPLSLSATSEHLCHTVDSNPGSAIVDSRTTILCYGGGSTPA